jgi:DNA-binding response OmpR family regulator
MTVERPSGPKILILDDDPSIAALFGEILQSSGYEVLVFTRYQDAREHLKHEVPDGLLADVRLDEYNGLQLAIFFRSLSPSGTIVMVSGHDDPVIRKEASAVDAAFLPKPVDASSLLAHFTKLRS